VFWEIGRSHLTLIYDDQLSECWVSQDTGDFQEALVKIITETCKIIVILAETFLYALNI
jgi:hypothetical protein